MKLEGVFQAFEGFTIGDREVTLEVTKKSKSPDRRGPRSYKGSNSGKSWSKDRKKSGYSDRSAGSKNRRERRR
jgi:hypothetical protein